MHPDNQAFNGIRIHDPSVRANEVYALGCVATVIGYTINTSEKMKLSYPTNL
jgi:hypothetical protein